MYFLWAVDLSNLFFFVTNALYNSLYKRMVNPPFYDKIVRVVPADWKEAMQEREVCTLDDNCYVSVNGDKLELQNLGHNLSNISITFEIPIIISNMAEFF